MAENITRDFHIKTNETFAKKILERADDMGGSVSGYIRGLIMEDLRHVETLELMKKMEDDKS